MEINVTRIMNETELTDFSDSIFNSGLDNIGQITWRNACAEMKSDPLVTTAEQLSDLADWIADFGAWSDEEIQGMSDAELNALLLQFVAGEGQRYQEAEENDDLDSYLENEGGNLWRDDNGQWWFYVGC